MQKLLTIAIPTYNRAQLLDSQLERLYKATDGYQHLCDIVVSNNQSTDETADIIRRWESRFSNMKAVTQPTNIGAVKNICWCLSEAKTDFVWALSDDDPLVEDALQSVFERLQKNPDLAVLLLNFSSHDSSDGSQQSERKFNLLEDESDIDGMKVFSRHISRGAMGALVFTSALIYRSDYARIAIAGWNNGHENLLFQLYITAYCATLGRFVITHDVIIRFMEGRSFFHKDKQLEMKMRLTDVPQTYANLLELGYPRDLCKELFLNHMKGKHFNGLRMWLQIAKYSIRHPRKTALGLAEMLRSFFMIWRGDEKIATQSA